MSIPAWELTQERVFARWCTQNLGGNPTVPDDGLIPALENGVTVCQLMDALGNTKLRGVTTNPSNRFQKLGNCNIALKYCRDENIKLESIQGADIVDQNRKLIMGLIWTLILKYQIGKGSANTGQDQAKDELLRWVQNQVKPYDVKVNNFSGDWQDARVLCALVDSLKPNSFNVNSLQPDDAYDNAKHAIDIAQTDLLIPRMMEPEDFANQKPDEHSVMTYVSYFRDAVNSGRFNKKEHIEQKVDLHKPTGGEAKVELFLSLATFSQQVKKDIMSLKYLLDKKKVKYVEYDVGISQDKKEYMQKVSGKRELPQLFVNDKYIGGYEEVQMLEEVGQLSELLGQKNTKKY